MKKRIVVRKIMSHNINVVKSKAMSVVIAENVTIPELLWRNLQKWPEQIAMECADTKRSYTYAQLHQRSASLTKYLHDSPFVAYQSTVCIISPNIPEYPIILIGCLQCGLKVTALNPAYKSDEIEFQLLNSDSKLIFTNRNVLPVVQEALNRSGVSIPIVVLNFDSSIGLEISQQASQSLIDFNKISSGQIGDPVEVNSNDVALVPYSSGTTGLPKGVELTHRNIVANLSQIMSPEFATLRDTTEYHQDVSLALLPFFHCFGMISCLFHSICRGSKLITFPTFGSEVLTTLLKEYRPTVLKVVPCIAHMIVNNPKITSEHFSRLRVLLYGAAPTGAADTKRLLDKIGNRVDLIQGYGLTEASLCVVKQSKLLGNGIKPGGSGLLIPNTEAKVIAIDGSATDVGLGPFERGELLVRGPQVMKGYYKNPGATAETILEGGWLRTGDMVYYDEHEHFFITDRLKEMIRVKGFQVAPAELEEVLRGHPDVREAAVIGIPHAITGECPRAIVVLKRNGCGVTTEAHLKEFVKSKLADHKQLSGGVVFIDQLPKSPSGKVLRRVLKEQYMNIIKH